jgi:LmbE family N-acetylglucosaminyl deacetylase
MRAAHLGIGAGKTSILCIGAHCDDIELGCGGTLIELQQVGGDLTIHWAILTGNATRQREAAAGLKRLVKPGCRGDLAFGAFPDAHLPMHYSKLKDHFSALQSRFRPDVVFTHEHRDAHQDHRILSELTWGAFRDHAILEYEIIKWDGNHATPNVYVPLTKASVRRKVATLMRTYQSQRNKDWFNEDTFLSIMRLRGIECRAPSGYAEAYFARKLTLLP